jgi:hypothetical protein
MIAHNLDINCTNARLYYYDFLSEDTREGIPDGALQHIKHCRNCQTEMDRLKDLLEHADQRFGTEQGRKDAAIGALLRLHFDYIGEPVKCNTVKPFLASLADPVLQIRIPTPITAHLEKCKSCRDDLKILLDLHLPHKYLCRLGQLLADKPAQDDFSCAEARTVIPDVVSLAFEVTNADVLNHLSTCPDCRERLYQHREDVCEELMRDGVVSNGFPCESVSAADIYDYCLPYGIDPADDEYLEFREPLISHLRSCPTCLAKIQELHRTISDIAERAESGVVTVYRIEESVKTESDSESEPYAGFPVNAETTGAEETLRSKQAKTINLAARLKQKVPALSVKPLLKAGFAAAAVMAIGFVLFFNSSPAGAVTIEQICRAIKNAKNVYTATFGPGKTGPIQQTWVSRSLNIYMTKSEEESVLWNLEKKVMNVKNLSTGHVDRSRLSAETVATTEGMVNKFLGIATLAEISVIADDPRWHSVGNDLRSGIESNDAYELTWLKKTGAGSTVFNKWLFFVDPNTSLPRRVESYEKLAGQTEFTLSSTVEYKYLSDSDMRAIIDEASS